MKNATRILALVFVLAMVMTCFAGMLTTASAADAPTPNAVIDFGDPATLAAIGTDNDCAFEQKNGYVHVTGKGLDSWFVLNPAKESPVGGAGTVGNSIKWIVIKYRTASTSFPKFYWEATDGSSGWAEPTAISGSAYNGTNEWSYAVISAKDQWSGLTEAGVYNLRFDLFENVIGTIDLAYIKFFEKKADANAYVTANTVTGTVAGKTLDASEVIFNGNKAYYVPAEHGTATELTPVTLQNVGEFVNYDYRLQNISNDAMFIGTGTSVDGTSGLPIDPPEGGGDAYSAALPGETLLGRGDYPDTVGGTIKVTAEDKYIRLFGWTSSPAPVAAYGYQFGDNEPVFDAKFIVRDEGFEGTVGSWGHANPRRFCITIPLENLEPGKAYAVQSLVKTDDGVVSTLKSGFYNFRVVTGTDYDFTDAQGNGYVRNGDKVISNGTEFKYFTNDEKHWAVKSDVIIPVTSAGAPTNQPANLYTERSGGGSLDCIDDGGWPDDGNDNAIYYNNMQSGVLVDAWLYANDPVDITNVKNSFALEGWERGDIAAVGYILDGDVSTIKWDSDPDYAVVKDEGLISIGYVGNCRRYKVHINPADIPDGYHTIEPVHKLEGSDKIYSLGWNTFWVLKGEPSSQYTFSDYTYSIVKAPGAVTYTATFMDINGDVVARVNYEEGATSIAAPAAPAIEGYDGYWNAYTLNGNITVTPYYVVNEDLVDIAEVKVQITIANGANATVTITDGNDEAVTVTADENGVANATVYYTTGTATYTIVKDGYETATGSITLTNNATLTTAAATLVEKTECAHANKTDANVTAATCGKDGSKDIVCDDCGETLETGVVIPATGAHTEETVPGKNATCTETGLTDGKKCSVCGKTTVAQETIPTVAHTEEIVPGKAASCTETGLTDGKKCSVCGKTIVAQSTIPAPGHDSNVNVPGKDATCTATGLTDGKKCSVCGETTVAQETIPVAAHTEEIIPAVPATTTAPGSTEGKKCSVCQTVLVAPVEIPQLEEACAHENTTDKVTLAPTCTVAGKKDVVCDDCGATVSTDVVIDALGHDYDEAYTAPTFEADGFTTYTCSVCGDSYVETDEGTKKIAAASVNGVKYETLEAAIAAAQAGDTVVVLADQDYDNTNANAVLDLTGLTLDLNGKTIYTDMAALWLAGSNVTIKNGTFDGKGASYALWVGTDADIPSMASIVSKNVVIDGVIVKGGILLCNISDVTIKNCDVNADVDKEGNDFYAVWADLAVSNVTIESGKFVTAAGKKPVNDWEGGVTVTGGTFSEKIEDKYCAEGYIQIENADGSFTAAACTHTWTDANCVAPKTCSVCGMTEGEALGHAWTDATCSAPKTCSVCGATEGEATGVHTPGAAATCTTAQTCVNCDYVFKPAKGHDYNITHVGATCTTYAYDVYECKNCDYKIDKANIGNEYAAHTPNVAAPTCTQNKYCTVCNTELAPELGHNYKTVVTAPTCTEQGYTTYTCANCGDVKVADYVAATGHTEKALAAVAPDCVNTGLTEGKICTVCGETLVAQETVAALGHTEVIVPGTAATCLEGGISDGAYCSVCGETTVAQEEIAALGHTEETIPAVNATCVADGKTAGVKCAVCGEILAAQQIVPATGHSNVTVPGYAATCTEAGLTAGTKCSVCNEVIVAQTAIAPNGHSTRVLPAVGATCTETGLSEGRQCNVCGAITVKQETTPVIPHTQETVAAVAPTCTATGLTEGKKCIVCGTVTVEQQTVAALGHVEETVPGAAASCTEAGMTDGKKCSVCGEITVAQEEIPAAGHTEEIIPAVDATYESTGLTEGKKCSVCGEILVAQVVTDKLPAKGDDTAEEEETTKAPETTEAPATDAPATEAPVTSDEATTEAKGGCGSVIGMSAAAVVLAAAAAAVALKKKED